MRTVPYRKNIAKLIIMCLVIMICLTGCNIDLMYTNCWFFPEVVVLESTDSGQEYQGSQSPNCIKFSICDINVAITASTPYDPPSDHRLKVYIESFEFLEDGTYNEKTDVILEELSITASDGQTLYSAKDCGPLYEDLSHTPKQWPIVLQGTEDWYYDDSILKFRVRVGKETENGYVSKEIEATLALYETFCLVQWMNYAMSV